MDDKVKGQELSRRDSKQAKKLAKQQKKAERKQKRKEYRLYKKDIKRQYRRIRIRQVGTYLKWGAIALTTTVFIGVGGAGVYLYGKFGPIVEDAYHGAVETVDLLDMGVFTDREPTLIKDVNGNVLRELAIHDFEYVKIEDIPDNIKLATIAVEDERFLSHEGVDLKAIARAGYQLVKNNGAITQGGSTITQQLVKNTILTHEQTYSRKLSEVFIAYELEKRVPKRQILEYYLNNIYFGKGAYGIESASNYYFSKPAKDLTLAEATFLMTFPNNPSLYDPFRFPENVEKRQSRILQKMLNQGYITKAQFTEASLQHVEMNITEKDYEPESYLESYAISDATKKLMALDGFEFRYHFENNVDKQTYIDDYNESFKKNNEAVRRGGYIIETSLDPKTQQMVQDQLNKVMSYSKSKNKETGLYKRQAATTTIDNETGYVVAIVGGRTQDDVANTYNRANLARRQPGSTIKPLLVYTPLLERSHTKESTVVDEPVEKGPKNVTGKYIGKTTVEQAVIQSINTIPYRLIQKIGVQESLNYLREMHFGGIVDQDDNPTVAIGGFTYGATPLEMASAYATLARNGVYMEPTAIRKISKASNGEVLYINQKERKQVYDAGASYLMTEILEATSNNGNPATGLNGKLPNHITATKTGTTNGVKDVWYAGYSPYYTTVVWVGEDTPKGMTGKTSYGDPLSIWSGVMKKLHENKAPITAFTRPAGALSNLWVNPKSGRVSKTAVSGWTQRLVPTSRLTRQEEEDRKVEEARQRKLEEERKRQLEEERKQREAKLRELENVKEYLKSRGTTLEAEDNKYIQITAMLENLADFKLTSTSQYTKIDTDIESVQLLIDGMVYVEYKEKAQKMLQDQILLINNQKELIEKEGVYAKYRSEIEANNRQREENRALEQQRLGREMKKKLEDEAKRLEAERLEQERLNRESMERIEDEELVPTPTPQDNSDATPVEPAEPSQEVPTESTQN